MTKLQRDWIHVVKLLACGENDFLSNVWTVSKSQSARVAPGLFPPELIIQIKALACEIPAIHNVPLSRWTAADLGRYVRQSGVSATISDSTIWRGFMKMPLSRGSIALGYSPVIPSLPLRQVESLICMKEYGIMITSKKMNMSSPLMKKPVSRHGIEFTSLIQQSQAQR